MDFVEDLTVLDRVPSVDLTDCVFVCFVAVIDVVVKSFFVVVVKGVIDGRGVKTFVVVVVERVTVVSLAVFSTVVLDGSIASASHSLPLTAVSSHTHVSNVSEQSNVFVHGHGPFARRNKHRVPFTSNFWGNDGKLPL